MLKYPQGVGGTGRVKTDSVRTLKLQSPPMCKALPSNISSNPTVVLYLKKKKNHRF